ncbi:MAG: glycosyltransferase family 39 protein [Labilithrix sp.]|nr:glycosyltransferase family 39 protein [Labilithrix sp.]MCW5810042.1 glycosyltransferase family 39 protein [Labilithrix sp.]
MAARRYLHPALFFVVAFVLRFVAARLFAGEPVWDGHYYDFGARRIAEGHGYSDDRVVNGVTEWHPWCHYPVGYSAFLALFYVVLGSKAWVAQLANSLTGALVVVVVYELARATFTTHARAVAAGVVAALHPGMVLYGALVMGEMLAALTVMGAFLVTLRLRASHRPLVAIGGGAIVLGLGALVRPQALLCAPFLALAIEDRSWRSRAVAAAVGSAMSLAPVLPWSARNCAVMDGCALVSTNAGWNLAIGSFPRATGRFETLRSSDGCREVTGQVQQDRCWLHYGIANVTAAPGRWLALVPAKLSFTFDHESFQVEYLREARPSAWPEERRVRWRQVTSTMHRLLVVAMPLAFVALVRRRGLGLYVQAGLALAAVAAGWLGMSAGTPIVWPLVVAGCALPLVPLPGRPRAEPALLFCVVLVASTALTHAVFFGEDRYHVVTSPALCLLAAAMLRPANTRGADTRGVRAAGESSS